MTRSITDKGIDRFLTATTEPVDVASLIAFRIGFGAIAAWWAMDYLRTGEVEASFVTPRFHFTYWLFDWVQPWPAAGPYLHFVAMLFFAGCIAVGLAYRAATILFALGFTIFFLWDRTNYQNHYYLVLLLSCILVCLPLNRAASLDVVNSPQIASSVIPKWMLWLVRFQIAVPYVYGGIAKLNAEWLSGAGLRDFLVTQFSIPLIGPWLSKTQAAMTIAWSGMLFDLCIVPLLLWRRTRVLAYCAAVAFHLCNHFLFSIHIFPWFMIMATTVFFDPNWPRRLGNRARTSQSDSALMTVGEPQPSGRTRWCLALVAAYVVVQILLPLRHLLYSGDAGWHERGHYFAWRMMLRTKRTALRVYMTDRSQGDSWNVDLFQSINLKQLEKCSYDPEMILDLAHQLRDDYQRQTGRIPEIRCLVLCCYNGRRPQLLIDPTVDLAQERRGFHSRPWICPQAEPIPAEPWSRPVSEWQQSIELPPLPVVTRGPHGEKMVSRSKDSNPASGRVPSQRR